MIFSLEEIKDKEKYKNYKKLLQKKQMFGKI